MESPIVFFHKLSYVKGMYKNILYLIAPLFLTGCVGSLISGHTERLSDKFPDIREVPGREEATKSYGLHKGAEKTTREADFKKLEQDREEVNARNQALREGRFPEVPQEKKP